MHDVIIIGAGPVGSYTAHSLARLGYRVAVFEAKEAIGRMVCCTGIISRECYETFCPENTPILAQASSAKFFVPSGRYLRIHDDNVQAYIIDRAAFDVALARKAQEAGADYFLQSKVLNIMAEREGCQVEASYRGRRQIFQSEAIVVSCGFDSPITRQLGVGKISHSTIGAQTKVSTRISEVEVYFDQELADGGFAWLVPTADGRGLAGVITRHGAHSSLESLLSRFIAEGKISSNGSKIRQKAIPLSTLPRTYGTRLLVVGEAAGQVKPTTGGGIYFGLLSAELATRAIHEAFLLDDLSSNRLSKYEKKWKKAVGLEFRTGYLARKIYDKVSNKQIERIFEIVKSYKIHEQLFKSNKPHDQLFLEKNFPFDHHTKLISTVLRRPQILKCLATPELLFPIFGVLALPWSTPHHHKKENHEANAV